MTRFQDSTSCSLVSRQIPKEFLRFERRLNGDPVTMKRKAIKRIACSQAASGRKARECRVGNAPATGNESGPSSNRRTQVGHENETSASEMPASSTLATTLASRLPSRNRSLLRSPRRQGESFHLASIARNFSRGFVSEARRG